MKESPSSPHQGCCNRCRGIKDEPGHPEYCREPWCPCHHTQSSSEKLNVVNLPEPSPYKTLNIEVTTHASSSEKREFAGASYVTEKKCPSCLAGFSKEDLLGNCTCDDSRPYPSAEKERQDRAMNQIKENQELTSHVLFTHPNTSSEKVSVVEVIPTPHNLPHPNTEQEWEKPLFLLLFKTSEGASFKEIKSFIQTLLDKEARTQILMTSESIEVGKRLERTRWINQPANEHDEKIRAAERARLRKLVEGMKKPNVAYVNIIRNRTLTDILSLLEE